MSGYVYINSDRGSFDSPALWTVGHYAPDGEWHPDSDHTTIEAAAGRVHYLNGGNHEALVAALETALRQWRMHYRDDEGGDIHHDKNAEAELFRSADAALSLARSGK